MIEYSFAIFVGDEVKDDDDADDDDIGYGANGSGGVATNVWELLTSGGNDGNDWFA